MNKTVIAGAVMLVVGLAGGWALSQWRAPGAHPTPTAAAPAAAASVASAAERKVLYWYDPMVPSQKFDKPGKSPFMDMQLQPRYADEGDANAAAPGVSVSPAAQQSLGLRVATADKRALSSSIDAPSSISALSSRSIVSCASMSSSPSSEASDHSIVCPAISSPTETSSASIEASSCTGIELRHTTEQLCSSASIRSTSA